MDKPRLAEAALGFTDQTRVLPQSQQTNYRPNTPGGACTCCRNSNPLRCS